jgi:hypothetical protein
VLPEDDANRQIAVAFHLALDPAVQRRIQILNPAGGWLSVLDAFDSDHAVVMDRIQHRFMILVIDFDNQPDRMQKAKEIIPEHLRSRVFVVGTMTEPEKLKRAENASYAEIGQRIAADCLNGTETMWGHRLLRHNEEEVKRLRQHIRPILFN